MQGTFLKQVYTIQYHEFYTLLEPQHIGMSMSSWS
jgi:hypothetical protein